MSKKIPKSKNSDSGSDYLSAYDDLSNEMSESESSSIDSTESSDSYKSDSERDYILRPKKSKKVLRSAKKKVTLTERMLENSEDSIDLYLSSDDSSVDLNRKPKKMIKKNSISESSDETTTSPQNSIKTMSELPEIRLLRSKIPKITIKKQRIHAIDSDFWKTTSEDSEECMPKKVNRSKKRPAMHYRKKALKNKK